ncbi:hypothetical protein ACFLQV_00925, partial [Calditrichota bacterium]
MNLSRFKIFLYCLLLFTSAPENALAVSRDEFVLHTGTPQIGEFPGRGRWTAQPHEVWLDMNSDWSLYTSSGKEIGQIGLPFCWEEFSGDLILAKRFTISNEYSTGNIRLVVERFAQSITVMLNDIRLDTRRGDGGSFQLEIDPRTFNFDGESNDLIITLNNELPRRAGLPLTGSIYTRKRYGGIYGGIKLVHSSLPAIQDIEARWLADGSISVEADLRVAPWQVAQASSAASVEISLLDRAGRMVDRRLVSDMTFPTTGGFHFNTVFPKPIESSKTFTINCSFILIDKEIEATFNLRPQPIEIVEGRLWQRNSADRIIIADYIDHSSERGAIADSAQLMQDLMLIRDLGADAVRVWQGGGSDLLMEIAEDLGLLVMLELPLNQTPDPVLREPEFVRAAQEQAEMFISRYRRYENVAAWGVGSQIHLPSTSNRSYFNAIVSTIR